jgi:hypothetical protein
VHELGEVAGAVEGDSAEGGAQAGHEQSGGDAFAGDIADGEAEAAILEREDVVVVAADAESGAAGAGERGAGNDGHFLREKALLDFAGDLHFAIDALALGGFRGEGVGELADFESESGLASHGLQHLQVSAGPGSLRALGTEGHDAHEAVAAGQRHEQLGIEQVESATLGGAGHQVPGVRIVAVEPRRFVGIEEIADGRGLCGQSHGSIGGDAYGLLHVERITAAKQQGDLADVQRIADAARDGFEERLSFSKTADFVGELVEHHLGVVGFTEELTVEPLLEALTDSKAQGKNEDQEDQGSPDVRRLRNASFEHGQKEAESDDGE